MATVPPHPSTVHDAAGGAFGAHGQQAGQQPAVQSLNQSAEFFLSNYRLGKTLGIGSFGKVGYCSLCTGTQTSAAVQLSCFVARTWDNHMLPRQQHGTYIGKLWITMSAASVYRL